MALGFYLTNTQVLRENIVPMFMSFHEKKWELFYNLSIYMAIF